MLSTGVVVVDVSANRRAADTERGYEVVGDVDYDSAAETARAITPVPGGVGPVTLAALLGNVVLAAERRADGARDETR
jgi:methylenetetrahydrofolate dehydrogenase (NADP+)/methenyltetrahydrofolate cyclohydrolase